MTMRRLLAATIVAFAGITPWSSALSADYTIKFAHNMPQKDDAVYHIFFNDFAERAAEYTNGAVELREFPAAQMGSDQQAAKKLQVGGVEMMIVASNNLAQLYSGFDLFTLPFLFRSMECGIENVLGNDDVIQDLSGGSAENANIRVLALSAGGMRNMMNSKHPINSPADLKGLRMRVAKNPIQLDTYKALGADAMGIAAAETYGALQTRIVDGHDGGSSWAYAQKLYEVQDHYALTGHQLVVPAIIVNNDYFESLPPEVQDGLTRAAREAAKENMKWLMDNEQKIYAAFKEAGLEFSEPDLAPFRDAVRPVWDQYAERVGGQERIDRTQALQEACN